MSTSRPFERCRLLSAQGVEFYDAPRDEYHR